MTGKRGGKREGAGRKPQSLDKLTKDFRDSIETKEIIKFLNDVAMGREVVARVGNIISGESDDFYEGKVKPTIEQRLKAADVLLKKAVPDLKAVEHSGFIGTQEDFVNGLSDPPASEG